MRRVTIYTDYKSPYAYLAKDLAYELERDRQVQLEWLPYVLDIPSFLGSARVDTDGTVLEEDPVRTSGVVCATATWTVVARRTNADW